MNPGIIVLFVFVVIAIIAIGMYMAYLRRKMWREIAKQYGFRHHRGDPFQLTGIDFSLFDQGHSRNVNNTVHGDYHGTHVILFDYSYKTGSGKHQSTYSLSASIIELPIDCPYLQIRPEHFMHRLAAFFGFDDFNFEYEKFNRAFRVTGDSKKFAYDICHSDMMEFLLGHTSMCWELRDQYLLLYESSYTRIDKQNVQSYLDTMKGFAGRIPEYLTQS